MTLVIDVGALSNGGDYEGYGPTIINYCNPVNFSGTITEVQIQAGGFSSMGGTYIAAFYEVSPGVFSARAGRVYIGTVTYGSVLNFSVSLNVEAGDYIGVYYSSGRLMNSNDAPAGEGIY